jgi:uracil phosphoribosyltransferase
MRAARRAWSRTQAFVAVEYFFKSPSDLHERLVIVISPVLATANTAVAAVDRLKERGANDIRLVSLIGVPKRCRAHARHSPRRSDLARGD